MSSSSNRQVILGIASQAYIVYTLLSLISLGLAGDTPTFYIFGDSGVDVGNNLYINTIAKPVFPNGIDFGKPFGTPSRRYSNAQELGLKNFPAPYLAPTIVGDVLLNGVNYASSGSGILNSTGIFLLGRVISLENQIRYIEYRGSEMLKSCLLGAIYIVATGGNDVGSSIPQRNSSSDGLASLDLRFDTILSALRSQLIGARKFVAVNSPPVGCAPFVRDILSKRDGCVSLENQMSPMYNPKLKSMLEELTKNLTGSQYVNANSYAIKEDIIQNYIQYGAQSASLIDHRTFIFPLIPHTFCFSGFQDVRNAYCYVVGAHGEIVPCVTISQVCWDRTSYVF
ncbi:hypothetical protein OIU84_021885 [Salix udensis]|uniref:GDSL esterase/lipase n=1 Tax=Salix udensis TaxID=889485 RepID=A0AAD6KW10_9ROSI|nr:hypothetical protein OIU84_021885 [Salix udensis]